MIRSFKQNFDIDKITNIDIDITKLFQLNLLTWKYLFFAYKLEIITHK